jgi:hypothetical protein
VADNAGLRRVISDDETGFRGTNDAPYRMEAWDFVVAGGGIFNHLDYSFAVGHEDGSFVYPASQPGGGNAGFRRQMRFLRVALLPGLWPYLTGFGMYLGVAPWLDGVMDNRWESAIFVVVAGLAYCVVQFGVLWVLQLSPEERHYVSTKLRRRRSAAMIAP